MTQILNFKKFLITILFLFIILGIVVRSIEVINGNYLWGFDHGREYLMVRDIVINKNPILIGTPLGAGSAGFQGIFHGPGYYYLLAIPFILFNGDPYGGVVLMFLLGIGVILISFLLASRMFGRVGALFATALISLSPPLIAQSRSIWSPHASTLFIVLSFLFSFLFINEKKRKKLYVFLASFFGGFVYNFEFAIAVPVTLSIVGLSIYIFRNKNLLGYLSMFLGMSLSYSAMIIFEVRHNFMAVNGIFNYLKDPPLDKNKTTYLENLYDHFGSFLFNFINSFPSQNIIPAFIFFIILIISFIYLVRCEKKELKTFLVWLSLFPIITFFVLSFLRNTVYSYYLYHLNIVYIFLFVYVLLRLFSQKKYFAAKIFYLIILLIFFIQALFIYPKMIAYDINDYGGKEKINGKRDAIDYIYKNANGKDFNLLIFSPPVYTYPFDYLIEWHGMNKYGFKPGSEKKGTFYLLMEVDPAKPWSYKGWLETVIKDGKIVSEVTLPSGLIVQKRESQ